jgi:hypothetical protein
VARIKLVQQVYRSGVNDYRVDPLGPFTTDENAWMIAEAAAEKHVAAWLFILAGRPVPGYEAAELVHVDGLARRKPHSQGRFTWQCEGAALLIATGLNDVELDARLSDYRTAEGRIDRVRSASSQRAALICAEMEAGVHPRVAIDRHRLPSVRRDIVTTTSPTLPPGDAAALQFYREMIAAGELANQ